MSKLLNLNKALTTNTIGPSDDACQKLLDIVQEMWQEPRHTVIHDGVLYSELRPSDRLQTPDYFRHRFEKSGFE